MGFGPACAAYLRPFRPSLNALTGIDGIWTPLENAFIILDESVLMPLRALMGFGLIQQVRAIESLERVLMPLRALMGFGRKLAQPE